MGSITIRNLDDAQLARTRRTGAVPNDVRAGPRRAEIAVEPGGIAFPELSNETQRHLMLGIAETYISNLPRDLARARMARLESTARALRFEWAGGFETSDLHYYRLNSPALSIEYATRERVSHVHTLWREPGTEFVARFLGHDNIVELPGRGKVLIRRDALRLAPPSDEAREGTVTRQRFREGRYVTHVATAFGELVVDHDLLLDTDTLVAVRIDESGVVPLTD